MSGPRLAHRGATRYGPPMQTTRFLYTGLLALATALAMPASARSAQPGSELGEFEAQTNVGPAARTGSARYDKASGEYRISGSGVNMWGERDEFHLVWKRMTGDFILTARASFEGEGVDPHRKLGWMVRSGLETDSPYADAAVHGDGLTSLQFRREAGGPTEEIRAAVTGPDVIRLAREGSRLTLSVARYGDPLQSSRPLEVDLGDEVYVGLFVCSHDPEVTETARFRDVRIVVPAPAGLVPYRDYLGSRLELLDVQTGDREVVHTTGDSLQAPNWTPDGKHLIYNHNGRLYRFDLETRTPEAIDTGFATRNNNDHVLSFDGTRLGISHHAEEHEGRSIVYTLPASGGTPKKITPAGPSYLHGWSPDARWLTYTAERGDGNYDIYRIPATGGEEERLTIAAALDDGSEYAPDGAHIYFNSARGGPMQLWRMKPDGSDQLAVTDDGLNNWFPHVSPDGRWIAFLSYQSDVDPADHPFYRPVTLRLMPAAGGEARVIAYLYGGQGTINVPSWAPDSRRLAFVSNSVLE